MKTYLPKSVKIIHFLSRGKTQKCSTKLCYILAFSTIRHLQTESRIQQEIFLHVILVRIVVPCSHLITNRVNETSFELKNVFPLTALNQSLQLIEQDLNVLSCTLFEGLNQMECAEVQRFLKDLGLKPILSRDLIFEHIIPTFKTGKWQVSFLSNQFYLCVFERTECINS